MASKKIAPTKAPSHLSISREGGKFTLTWKIADKDYDDGQKFQYYINVPSKLKKGQKLNWSSKSVGKKATSQWIKLDLKKYYPYTYKDGKKVKTYRKLYNIHFRVLGDRNKYKPKKKSKDIDPPASEWSKYKLNFSAPPAPSLSASHSVSPYNVTTFSWSVSNTSLLKQPYTQTRWNTAWTNLKDYKSGSEVPEKNWSASTIAKATGAKAITEDNALFATDGYSYTRWFRIRSEGPAGPSKWIYAKHVYAMPLRVTNASASVASKSDGGYNLSATWSVASKNDYPIDEVRAEYAMTVPDSSSEIKTIDKVQKRIFSISCPVDEGIWSNPRTMKDTGANDGTFFPIDRDMEKDECIFFRANTVHDELVTTGNPTLATNGIGQLADPTVTQISVISGTHRVEVQATNNSAVTNSFLVVYYRTEKDQKKITPIGIMPYGTTQGTFQLPEWEAGDTPSIGVRAMLANYTPISAKPLGTVTQYTLDAPIMASEKILWDEGRVPSPPEISLETAPGTTDTIRVTWNWTWNNANQAEISWADHSDAWESTNEPSTYIVNNSQASQWNISGLDIGTWYVRVRLLRVTEESTVYGLYSEEGKSHKLAAAPDTPTLTIPESVVTEEGKIVCYWVYASNDGTPQAYAAIHEAFLNTETGTYTYSESPLAQTNTLQQLSIDVPLLIEKYGWHSGDDGHYLAVTVTSASKENSKSFSQPVPVTIAAKPVVTIENTSLVKAWQYTVEDVSYDVYLEDGVYYYVTVEDSQEVRHTVNYEDLDKDDSEETPIFKYYLTRMPLTVTATGAGETGETRFIIERAESFQAVRPDERTLDGFAGETVALVTNQGESEVGIEVDDLLGNFDDTAEYTLRAEITDNYNQSGKSDSIRFKVKWEHQAVYPSATVHILPDEYIAVIRPLMPESGYDTGDVCDIYRLSVDRPELIYSNAVFGTDYVDPYPTLGEYGGHRIVYKTANGDYTASDGRIAWLDLDDDDDDILDVFGIIINFGSDTVMLPYNISLSNQWKKSFTKTVYLGGSVEGDWNYDVERTSSAKTVSIVEEDRETIEAMRRLADYPGICHVRTPEGSSFAANVDVSEDRDERMINKLVNFSLSITRVDPEEYDAMTLTEWRELHPLEVNGEG